MIYVLLSAVEDEHICTSHEGPQFVRLQHPVTGSDRWYKMIHTHNSRSANAVKPCPLSNNQSIIESLYAMQEELYLSSSGRLSPDFPCIDDSSKQNVKDMCLCKSVSKLLSSWNIVIFITEISSVITYMEHHQKLCANKSRAAIAMRKKGEGKGCLFIMDDPCYRLWDDIIF